MDNSKIFLFRHSDHGDEVAIAAISEYDAWNILSEYEDITLETAKECWSNIRRLYNVDSWPNIVELS
jgi:hypothetical protein